MAEKAKKPKPKPRPPKPFGRPTKLKADDQTLRQIARMASSMATMEEIGSYLDVTKKTFLTFAKNNPLVAEAIARGQLNGKLSLRQGNFRLAKKNATMAIFLSSHYLGLENYRGAASAAAADLEDGGLSGTELLNRRIAGLRAALVKEFTTKKLERSGPIETIEGVAISSPPEATSP